MSESKKRSRLVDLRKGNRPAENANGYWTEEDKQKSKKMFEEGYGISDIALALKRTEVSVTCHFQNVGLFARQSRPRKRTANTKEVRCLCAKCRMMDCPHRGNSSETCEGYQKTES